jgi:hypothetical protein
VDLVVGDRFRAVAEGLEARLRRVPPRWRTWTRRRRGSRGGPRRGPGGSPVRSLRRRRRTRGAGRRRRCPGRARRGGVDAEARPVGAGPLDGLVHRDGSHVAQPGAGPRVEGALAGGAVGEPEGGHVDGAGAGGGAVGGGVAGGPHRDPRGLEDGRPLEADLDVGEACSRTGRGPGRRRGGCGRRRRRLRLRGPPAGAGRRPAPSVLPVRARRSSASRQSGPRRSPREPGKGSPLTGRAVASASPRDSRQGRRT